MSAPQSTIAVVFDFDDTLTDDSTTKLLKDHGIDTTDFWTRQTKELTDQGWDAPLAYLKLLLDNVGEGKPLGRLSNAGLRAFGDTLTFYQGIPDLFTDLRTLVSKYELSHPSIEFYIISGGLEEVIRGCKIARHFAGIWGCRLHEEDGCVRHVANAISYTEKTKYLFAINKGVDRAIRTQPYAVNRKVEHAARRIPFENMIYLGDGLTDVPCFSLIEQFHGAGAFGVFDPTKEGSPKKAWEGLVAPRRVTAAYTHER